VVTSKPLTPGPIGPSDCPPCWKSTFCGVPPSFTDNVYLNGTTQPDGSCVLTQAMDGGESLTIPLQCVTSSNPDPVVPWSLDSSGPQPTLIFNIPSKGTVNCQQS
jgi:hypothetical protein